MSRITQDDYYKELDLLSSDKAISKSIHTIGNRVNSIANAADLLQLYLQDRDNLPTQAQIDRLIEIIMNNTNDLAEVLTALGKYNQSNNGK